MDVKLPNGKIIKNVPEGTTKEQVKQKAIASGIATESDFGMPQAQSVGADGLPQLSINENPSGNINTPKPRETSVVEDIVGGGEAALSALTGAIAGAPAMAIGNIEGAIGDLTGRLTPEQARQVGQDYAQSVTYAPRTESGQRQVAAIGEALSALPPVLGGATPLQTVGASQAVSQAARMAPSVVSESAQAAKALFPQAKPQNQAGALSVGAAEVDGGLEAQRVARAESLPVPVKLTKGQRTQDFAQQQFEKETAKQADEGAAIRQRMQEQNQALVQNFDAFLDDIGTEIPETAYKLQTGQKVDEALRKRAAADKAKIRVAYKEAEKAGETNDPVSLSSLADYLNENRAEAGLAPIMQAVSKQLEVQGVGSGSLADGTLTIGEMTLNQAERLRKSINKFSSGADANNLRVAGELKQLIDDATEGAGGQKYQVARKLRKQYADNYERIGIVKNILGTKRGSNDRQIALENVVDKVVTNGSVDDLSQVRRLLQTQGAEGMAAWREMQAATIRHIRDEATKNVGRDPNGNPLVSAAQLNRTISGLDKNGKLEKIFGKKGAEQLRDLNDIARDVFVSQPNAVNNSNTSSALLAAMDMMMSAGAGVPTPILSGIKFGKQAIIKRKIEKRVEEALK